MASLFSRDRTTGALVKVNKALVSVSRIVTSAPSRPPRTRFVDGSFNYVLSTPFDGTNVCGGNFAGELPSRLHDERRQIGRAFED